MWVDDNLLVDQWRERRRGFLAIWAAGMRFFAIASGAAVEPAHDVEAPVTPNLVGETPAMVELYKMIGRLSKNDVPALFGQDIPGQLRAMEGDVREIGPPIRPD